MHTCDPGTSKLVSNLTRIAAKRKRCSDNHEIEFFIPGPAHIAKMEFCRLPSIYFIPFTNKKAIARVILQKRSVPGKARTSNLLINSQTR
ncbi:uncharacterized protein N7482_007340 [Penicillium canariense]|uniref:Uncharacterized protein n=1 Tax=Penicillium canariense TaxID=189055 RepID=A0A9W9LKH5_9EURO|nr:uncharacterized protein N7482_007340 [Penicillium canariense]KAJ5160336.1 hypothetical protein N7482_007340 [Penicillium canariense]